MALPLKIYFIGLRDLKFRTGRVTECLQLNSLNIFVPISLSFGFGLKHTFGIHSHGPKRMNCICFNILIFNLAPSSFPFHHSSLVHDKSWHSFITTNSIFLRWNSTRCVELNGKCRHATMLIACLKKWYLYSPCAVTISMLSCWYVLQVQPHWVTLQLKQVSFIIALTLAVIHFYHAI